MRYRHVLNRRTFLRAGGIAVGLPFLESMLEKSLFGAPPDPPVSVISLMHGLGTPGMFLDRGFEGALQYYKPYTDAKQLSLFTNIDMTASTDGLPADAQHHHGQPYFLSGYLTGLNGTTVLPKGPSMHWTIKRQAYPTDVPTRSKIVDCGIYFRRQINYQRIRIWDDQAKNAADVQDLASPLNLFNLLFGSMPMDPAVADNPKRRAALSILDYLKADYSKYTSAASNLPAGDIATIKSHLEWVRNLEMSAAYTLSNPITQMPVAKPTPPNISYTIDGGGEDAAYRVSAKDFETAYQIMADLFVTGLQMDLFRFGNLSFEAGGGHTWLTGAYPTPDDPAYVFNGAPHYNYHQGFMKSAATQKLASSWTFMVHENIAAVLGKLAKTPAPTGGGKTLLDSVLVLMGSEVGENHDVSRMFHALAGGNGKFKMGLVSNDRIKAIELYSAIGKSYGLTKVGDGRQYTKDAAILA
ncbi:MAG: DUF1552 domain-containing protein [Myxococcales bacterium]